MCMAMGDSLFYTQAIAQRPKFGLVSSTVCPGVVRCNIRLHSVAAFNISQQTKFEGPLDLRPSTHARMVEICDNYTVS